MLSRKQSFLISTMMAGVILGGLAGYFIPEFMKSLSVIGHLFLNLLKIITIPLIISVIIVGIASLGDTRKIGRATIASILYFLSTSAIAIIVGIILVSFINPGLFSASPETIAQTYIPNVVSHARSFNITDIFKSLIPANIIGSTVGGQYLGLIVISLIFGAVLATMGRKAKVVLDFFNVITDVSLKAVYGILFIAPLGLFFLVGSAIAENPDSIADLGGGISMLALTILAGFVIHAFIILPLILKVFGQKSPHTYAGKMLSALVTALGTSSSTATIPVTYSCVVEKNNIDSRAGSLVIPLGSFVNLNGTAMFLAITTIFACQMFGISLSILNIILIGLLSLVLSFCSAGVPGSSIFMMAILFTVVKLPNTAYAALGLLVAVDWLFDRGRTVLNVWGNAVGAAVIGEMFDFKTVSRSKSTSPTKKYDRSYDKKSGYKKDKPLRQNKKYTDRKTKEIKKPVAKKKERIESLKTKPKLSKNKKDISTSKKRTTPVTERKKSEVENSSQKSSIIKPPPLPPASKKNVPIAGKTDEIFNNDQLSNDTIERERAKIAAQLASMKEQEKSRNRKSSNKKSEIASDDKKISAPKIDFYSEDDQGNEEKEFENRESFFETNNVAEKVKKITIPESIGKSVIDEGSEIEIDTVDINDEQKTNIDNQKEPEPETETIKEIVKTEENNEHLELSSDDSKNQTSAESVQDQREKQESKSEPNLQFGRTRNRRGGVKRSDSEGNDSSEKAPIVSSSITVVENDEEISFGRTKKKRIR